MLDIPRNISGGKFTFQTNLHIGGSFFVHQDILMSQILEGDGFYSGWN